MRTLPLPIWAALVCASFIAGCRRCPECRPCPPSKPIEGLCCANTPNTPDSTGPLAGRTIGPKEKVDIAVADLVVDTVKCRTDVLDEGAKWHLTTRVFNGGDGCSGPGKVIVLLPAEAIVARVVTKGEDGAALPWAQCTGYIEVQLSTLCPGATYSGAFVDVFVQKSTVAMAACLPSFGVMVFSSTVDHVPSNNYWWWMDRCGTTSDSWTLLGPKASSRIGCRP